jgi:hypothetical protein
MADDYTTVHMKMTLTLFYGNYMQYGLIDDEQFPLVTPHNSHSVKSAVKG